jgi:outer membrane protein W
VRQISIEGANVSMHIAKISAGKVGLLRIGAALAVVAAALCFSPSTAQAQMGQSSAVGGLRIGTFIPVDSTTRQNYGNSMWDLGLDYTFQQTGTSIRDFVSVDYIQASKDSNNFQLIPITVGQQMLGAAHSDGVRPYAGYGVGAYILKVKNPGNTAFADQTNANGTQFGGYLDTGLDINNTMFVDARYSIAGSLKTVNMDGFTLTAGVRF